MDKNKKKRRDESKGASHEHWYVYEDDSQDKADMEASIEEIKAKIRKKNTKQLVEDVDTHIMEHMAKGKR